MVSVYVRSSLIQLHTPDAHARPGQRGSQLTISASNELGEAESGLLASLLGPVGAVVFGGVGAIFITLLWSRLFPELRLAKTFDPPEILQTRTPARSAQHMKANTILETIGNTPHIRVQRLFPGRGSLDQVRTQQSRRLDQGPHRAGDDRGGGGRRQAQARRHDRRADQRQHRRRAGDGRGGQGLQADPGHAREHVARTPPADAGLWRELRPDAQGKGHEGRDRPRAGNRRRRRPNSWLPQQFENPANIDVHVRTTAQEILEDFADAPIDVLITGVGTGGHITGVAETLKKSWPNLKVFAVEPELSPVISGGDPARIPIQGIGAGFIPANLHTDAIDGTIKVDAAVAKDMARRAAAEEGMLVGISSGATLAAILQKLPDLPDDVRVLGFNYDTGERYLSVPDFLPES